MKNILFLFAVLIFQAKLNAQATYGELENSKVMYPSPTAASLGKYGEYPVSLYNGMVNIGQDIVTVKSGSLELNVSLSYHASGNKPTDIPGWVGLGFSLNAGGVITRIIKDLPDDIQGGFYYSSDEVKSLWANYPTTHFIEQYYAGTIDPRSDIYQFNFGGKAGEFLFDSDKNIQFKQKVPFKVKVMAGPGGFGGFILTADDGTEYTFDRTEHSQVSALSVNAPTTSWYLTKIKNLSGNLIVLKYTEPTGKYRYKLYDSRKEVYGTIEGGILENSPVIKQTSSQDEVVYLDEIDFDNGKLLFNKSTRTDPAFVPAGITAGNVAERKLESIQLKDNGDNLVKQWKFEYFENSTERLKLKNLIAQTSDLENVQKYSFEYNSTNLPVGYAGPNATNPYQSNDVDYWGYYNGATNNDNRIPRMYITSVGSYLGSASREIYPATVGAEMLEKITYPTGGYTSFTYESNDYSRQGISYASSQNPLNVRADLTESYEFSYNRDDGGFDVDPTGISYTLSETTHVHISISRGADGPLQEWGGPGTSHEEDVFLPAGTQTLAGLLNTSILTSPGSADITNAHVWVTVYKEGESYTIKAKTGPGLRIKTIATNDGVTTVSKTFEYKLGNSVSNDVSSGTLSVFPAYYAELQSFAGNISGVMVTSDPINDVTEGPPVGYSRVVEHLQDNSYIIHYFTSYYDYPDDLNVFINEYSDSKLAHLSSNDFWRGREVGTEFYTASGNLQKKISNSFEVVEGSLTDIQALELKPTVGFLADPEGGVNYVNTTLSSYYSVRSCFLSNSYSQEELFDKNGEHPITTSVYRYYDNLTHLQPTRISTLASDGSLLTTATTYPDDYAAGEPFIDYMKKNHLISYPVEQVVYRSRGEENKIIGGNIIRYKAEGAGLVDQLLKLETAAPIALESFKLSSRDLGVLPESTTKAAYGPDSRYQTALTYTLYDMRGNPQESVKRNGIRTAYIWGYNRTLPVAEVVGADYATASGKITVPTIVNNPASDQALRDELDKIRAGIPGSMVTTYTFAPLRGVTSQTDPAGRTSYFEYDNFNRLKLIRDQNNAIIKKFDYKYNGQ